MMPLLFFYSSIVDAQATFFPIFMILVVVVVQRPIPISDVGGREQSCVRISYCTRDVGVLSGDVVNFLGGVRRALI